MRVTRVNALLDAMITDPHVADAMIGDLTEVRAELAEDVGVAATNRWHVREMLKSVPSHGAPPPDSTGAGDARCLDPWPPDHVGGRNADQRAGLVAVGLGAGGLVRRRPWDVASTAPVGC
ncbi:MAG: hypothetical protein L0G99_05010 [Propionibacteriales bacterium]|nr:hypothetical protein [Propionibacteriales bacterium]